MCRHQLLSRLEQYEALIQKLSVSVSVLLALQPTILFELAGLNMETGKQSSPPAQHYLHAAKRLRLTGSQVRELLRIRQMSNRMVSAVRSTGIQLVGQMADSFSVLTSLSAGSATTSQGVGQQAGTAQQQSGEASKQQEEGSMGSAEQREKDGVEAALLEQLMQRHVHNIADFLLVVSRQVCTAACACVQGQEVVVYQSIL
jgi:hypothetical protein